MKSPPGVSLSPEDFVLRSPTEKEAAREKWHSENLVEIAVASVFEEAITINVVVKNRRGKLTVVPMSWSPTTGILQKLHTSSWTELGIDEKVHRIRNVVIGMAKTEHIRRVRKHATLDLFPDQTEK